MVAACLFAQQESRDEGPGRTAAAPVLGEVCAFCTGPGAAGGVFRPARGITGNSDPSVHRPPFGLSRVVERLQGGTAAAWAAGPRVGDRSSSGGAVQARSGKRWRGGHTPHREEWKMLHMGRGRALLVLGVVWAVCLISTGCVMNVSFSNAPAPPPKDGQADKQDTTAKPRAPESVVPVGFE